MPSCPKCGGAMPPAKRACPACRADVSIWLARAGQVFGPYTLADLEQARAEGRLGPEDMVRVGDEQQWRPLGELIAMAAAPAPPPPMVGGPPPPAYAPPRPVRRKTEGLAVAAIVVVVGFMFLGIVGVLAAILFPVFAKAREKARQAACLANVKQISLGMAMYSADHGDRFPPAPLVPENKSASDGVVGQEASLSTQTYWTSDNWRELTFPYTKNTQIYLCPMTDSMYSYQFNEHLYGLPTKRVKDQSGTAAIYDDGFDVGSVAGSHNGGWNVGFVDGHAKWMNSNGGVKMKP